MGLKETLPLRPEAQRYALLLDWGSRVGLVLLVISFTGYLFGLLPAHVPPEQLPGLWTHPVATYLQLTHSPRNWEWITLIKHGDHSNMIGIAVLAGCSVPPLLALIPLFMRQRDIVYAIICALEVVVLLLAASGLLTSGH